MEPKEQRAALPEDRLAGAEAGGKASPFRWLTLTLVFFALDIASKLAVHVFLMQPVRRQITIIPGFFTLYPTRNPGIAFSLFANSASPWKTAVLTAIALGALAWFAWMILSGAIRRGAPLFAASLVCGGILGNAVNRLATGTVVDFLDFSLGTYSWPTFNLADSFISVGAAWMILCILCERRSS